VRLTSLALLLVTFGAPALAGCSSLGGIELGDDGPDRFPESDGGPSYPTTDPTTHGHDADDDESSSSGTTATPPGSIGHEDTEGDADTGSEGSSGDTDDVGTGSGTATAATTDEPSGPDDAETGGSETGAETSAGEGAGTNAGCEGVRLPPCPPACDLYEASPCGSACDMDVDEGYACGDEYGAGMVCEGGIWVCLDPPLRPGTCPMVCDPSAGA